MASPALHMLQASRLTGPSMPASVPVVYRTSQFTGSAIPNEGTAGSAINLVPYNWDGGLTLLMGAGFDNFDNSPSSVTWAAMGGDPGDAPWTFMAAYGPDATVDPHFMMQIRDLSQLNSLGGETYGSPATNFLGYMDPSWLSESTQAVTPDALYSIEIDPATGVITRRVNDTVITATTGDPTYGGSSASYMNTTWKNGSATYVPIFYFDIGGPEDLDVTIGQPWNTACTGMAISRSLLSAADRAAWRTYLQS